MKSIFIFWLAWTVIASFDVKVIASSPAPIPVVTTHNAALTKLHETLTYPARIESKVNAMIYAEADGVISKILAPLGSNVRRRQKIAVIKHTDPIYQYAPMNLISAGDLPLIKKGLDGELTLDGNDSAKLQVKVIGISPFVDSATGTATCELEISKSKQAAAVPPGAVGQINFKVNERENFVFPDHAIVYRGDQTFVRLVQNGTAKKVAVVLGRRERGQVEILKGIKAGDSVVERTSGFIAEGDKVQVENAASN
jgi:membrane fusion protein (multidrug efflux system)